MIQEEPMVVIEHVTKKYGSFVALDDLCLTLNRGEILGFIGPNGAGKTTTIKILVGHSRPTSGTAKINGVDCTQGASKIKKLVGYMPDIFGSYDNMRVSEYLDFFGAAFGMRRKQRRLRIAEVMEITGVTHMKDLFVESLSHGMQQRVGIARTLLHDPELIILDEPANGLDPRARIEMRQLLLDLAGRGKTLIVTSHILPELSRICNKIAIISHGILRADGPIEQILRQVNQKRVWEIILTDVEKLDSLQKFLSEHLEDEASLKPSEAEMTIRFQSSANDEEVQKILSLIVAQQFPVVQLREVQTDLEDTFMTVTQEGASQKVSLEGSESEEGKVHA